MIGPFAEAVRATVQPCTFLLVVPALVGIHVVRARWAALAASLVAAIVGGWSVAANRFILDGWALRLSGLAVAAVMAALAIPQLRARLAWLDHPVSGASIAAATTLLATMWWRPCVGDELGTILTAAQHGGSDLAGQLLPMAFYMIGAMTPVIASVLVVRLIEPGSVALDWTVRVAAGAGFVVAAMLFVGRHEDVVVTLTRWTLQ